MALQIMANWLLLALLLAIGDHVACAEKTALLIVDVQNCFTPGGTLEIREGDQVIDVINKLRINYGQYFDLVVLSQDWHCRDHVSFASQYANYGIYQNINLTYNADGNLCRSATVTSPYSTACSEVTYTVPQTLWPDHCVNGTEDAALHSQLVVETTDVIVRKGYHCQVDSYSVFYDNGGFGQTELQQILTDAGITSVFIAGLALDFCVYYTAKDAKNIGLKTYVLEDATRPVSVSGGQAAIADMLATGIVVVNSTDLEPRILQLTSASSMITTNTPFILMILFLAALLD